MRTLITTAVCLSLASLVAAQDKRGSSALPKKGDAVILSGCLRGGALESADVADNEDSSSPLLSGLTFRLTGKKDVLKELKGKHDGRVVQVRGKLKSELQPEAGYGANLGKMRITIGGPTGGAGARDLDSQRTVPVVEVSAFEGIGTACAR